MHSTSFEVEENELNMYIDQMILVLEDKKVLVNDGAAQSAMFHLKELKKDQIYISVEDVSEMRREALNAIADGIKDIENKKYEVIYSIEAKGKQIHDDIDTHFNKRLLEQEKNMNDKNVQTENETDLGDATGDLTAEEQDFQKYLVDLYLRDYVHVDVSPLSTELDEDVEKVYIPLKAERVRPLPTEPIYQLKHIFQSDTNQFNNIYLTGDAGIGKTTFCRKLISTWCRAKSTDCKELSEFSTVFDDTHSYDREHFSEDDDEYEMFKDVSHYDIYGESDESVDEETIGDDKTEYDADRMYNTKQQVMCDVSEENNCSCTYTADQIAIDKFDFLFFVSLRDTYEERSIEEMIKNQLLNDKFQSCFSNMIAGNPRRFLVILDGLDEWQPPSPLPTHPSVTKGLPLSSASGSYTKITTSRPWKTESLRPKFRERDSEVKLIGIGEHGSQRLIANLISKLSKKSNGDQISLFLNELKENDIEELKFVPLLVKLLVCLWCENGALEKSKTSIYSSVVDLMILRAEEKCSENEHFEIMASAVRPSSCELLSILNNFPNILRYSNLFRSLSRFAFHMLFRSKCGSMLVFKMNEIMQYGLTEEDVNLCLYFGILSQKSVFLQSKISKVRSVSFIHKTFQEYFAAMYISVNESDSGIILEVCDSCKSVDQFNEMRSTLMFLGEMNQDALYKVLAKLAILSKWKVEIVDRTLILKSKCFNITLFELSMQADFKAVTICHTDFESDALRLSDRMDKLDTLELNSVRMTHKGFKELLESVPKSKHGIRLKITCLTWNDDKSTSDSLMTITLQNLKKINITGTDLSRIYMVLGQGNHWLESVVFYMNTMEYVALSKLINSIKPTAEILELIVDSTTLKISSDVCYDFDCGLMTIALGDTIAQHGSTQFGNIKPVIFKELTIKDTVFGLICFSFDASQKDNDILELSKMSLTVINLSSAFDAASNQDLRSTLIDVDFDNSKYNESMSEAEILELVKIRCTCSFIPPSEKISVKYDISKRKECERIYICATICGFAQNRYSKLSTNLSFRRQINQFFLQEPQLRSLAFVLNVEISNFTVSCMSLCTILIALNDTFGYIHTFHMENSSFDGNADCDEWQQINEYRALIPKILTTINTSSGQLQSDRRYALLDEKTTRIIGPLVSDENLDCIASFVKILLGQNISKTLINIIIGQTSCLRATFKNTSIVMKFCTLNQQLKSTFWKVNKEQKMNSILVDSFALSNLKCMHLNLMQQLKRPEMRELSELKSTLSNLLYNLNWNSEDLPLSMSGYFLSDLRYTVSCLLEEIKEYNTFSRFNELGIIQSFTESKLKVIAFNMTGPFSLSEWQVLTDKLRIVADYFKMSSED